MGSKEHLEQAPLELELPAHGPRPATAAGPSPE